MYIENDSRKETTVPTYLEEPKHVFSPKKVEKTEKSRPGAREVHK